MQKIPLTPVDEPTDDDAVNGPEPGSPAPRDDAPPAAADAALATAAGTPAGPADLAPEDCAAQLAERFPALFAAGRTLPIKLRVQADIQQRAPGVFSRRSLSFFLHRHTTRTAYLKALVSSPHRFDLDGQPAGEVAADHRAAAATELERRLALVAARRAAERGAQRSVPPAGDAQGVTPPPQEPGVRARRPAGERPERRGPGRPGGRPGQGPDGRRTDHRAERRLERQPHRRPEGRPDAAARPGDGRPHRPVDRPPDAPVADLPPTPPSTPEQAAALEARRQRAALLRQYETTTLTRANFCALKGLSEAALEQALADARSERDSSRRSPSAPRQDPE